MMALLRCGCSNNMGTDSHFHTLDLRDRFANYSAMRIPFEQDLPPVREISSILCDFYLALIFYATVKRANVCPATIIDFIRILIVFFKGNSLNWISIKTLFRRSPTIIVFTSELLIMYSVI